MKKFILFLLLLCSGSIVMGQGTLVTGTIVSGADGEPLPGASVVLKGKTLGTVTNGEGFFSINVPAEGGTLVFSFVGFLTREENVTAGTKGLRIVLSEDTKMIEEVVVVGYGTMKRSDLTGSVSSIGGEAIKKSMSTSLEQAMQGRVSGVQITQNSGAPGGGISVSIRGINSLNGNEPLYVIDGVAISSQPSGGSTSVLSTINPADIVSLEVLKDASATAIYGSRASNGVVLITTKQGEIGKPRISYDGYFGLQQLPTKLKIMNLKEFAELYNERAVVMGWVPRPEYVDPDLLNEGTDWQKELFRTVPMHNHTLGVSGGSGGTRYAISGSYLDQDGMGIGSSFKRVTFRTNLDMEIATWLNVGVNGSVANSKRITTMDDNSIIREAVNQRPDIPAREWDGSYGIVEDDYLSTSTINPLAMAKLRENYGTGTQVYYNFYAVLKPLRGLNFRLEYGGSMDYGNGYRFQPNYRNGRNIINSESRKDTNKSNYSSLKTYLTYDFKKFGLNNLQIMAGHEAQTSSWENMWALNNDYLFNEVHSLSVGMPSTDGDGMGKWALESYFGRLNYNFGDRYLLTATIRADGSSTFGANNRWGTFPSVALAWRINNESFLNGVEAINNLKLRLGWGVNGNQNAGSYAYGAAMKTNNTIWGKGFYPGNYSNPDLKWERTEAYNIGLDLTLFKNRVELIAEAYLKKTDNLLLRAILPTYAVHIEDWMTIAPPMVNTGAMENKGLEFTLNTVNIDNKDFRWNSNLTFSLNRNKLTKMYGESDVLLGQSGGNTYTKTAIGETIGQIYVYNVIGMFTCEDDFYRLDNGNRVEVARPADANSGEILPIAENQIWIGDYIFEDVNGDGVIDERDRKVLGNTNPKFIFGFNNTFSYKNFELNVFLNGVSGNKVYNVLRQDFSNTGGWLGKLKEAAGFARVAQIDPAGGNDVSNLYVTNAATATTARINLASGTDMNQNSRSSSRFVEDGSYLRVKNISLGYTVPKPWLQKYLRIDYLQIYASVQNLYTFTKYKGFDPEVGSYDIRMYGIDNARYPSARTFTFGLRTNF